MSDKSDEDLVGDVDFDFDLPEDKEPMKRDGRGKGKVTESLKPQTVDAAKKTSVKAAVFQDDLLQAFAMGATNLKTDSKAKKKTLVKSKSDSVAASCKPEDQRTLTKVQNKEKSSIVDAKTFGEKEGSGERKLSTKGMTETADKEKTSNEKVCIKEKVLEENQVTKEFPEETRIKKEIKNNEDEESVEKKSLVPKDNREVLSKNISEVVKNIKVESSAEQSTAFETCQSKMTSNSEHRMQEKVANNKSLLSADLNKSSISKEDGRKETAPNAKATKPEDNKPSVHDLKRKAHDSSDKHGSAKIQKTDVSSEATIKRDTIIRFTEDDYKSMDSFLADQMLDKAKEKTTLRSGIKYTVEVSPLEIADLAHPSLQQLIQLHPTMSLIFKHQTVKFRKKKGFAEAVFSTMTELKEFVYQLTQIKVVEKRVDVTIKPMDQSGTLSFVIHLNRNAKLLKLLDSGEDPLINKPIPIGENPHKIKFEKVPSTASGAFMHSMFPFTNNVLITRSQVGKDKNYIFHGPVSVFYINAKWLEAVMDCCSDFTVNGFPLNVVGDYCPDEKIKKMDMSEERRTSVEQDQRYIGIECLLNTDDGAVADDDDDDDDPVSNMTRDVCADMLESIQKLKELEPNNPNMKKIVQMQNHLNALQDSLGKSQSLTSIESPNESSKHVASKEDTTEKKKRDPKSVEEKFEEAKRAEREKEEQLKHQRETEAQKRKEFEQKKKSQWMKNILSDFKKQEGAVGEKLSADAEKMLKQRERRLKEKEEEEKRRKEEEIRIQEEEEKKRKQREQEERFREAERKRLIEKIEETRLKDSQKFSSSQLLWNPSEGNKTNAPPSSSSPAKSKRDRDSDRHHSSSKTENPKKSRDDGQLSTTSTSGVVDDGVDARLADFARELMQQGKIENKDFPFTSSSRSTSTSRQPSKREEPQEDVVVSEEEYKNLVATNQIHAIPEGRLKVRVSSIANRLCPVQDCPSKTNFRTMELLMDHWIIFHQAQTTMRFCPKCSAYFMNVEELENHIMKHHRLSSKEAVDLMRRARTKVIPNPSYRNPHPFIPPFPLS